MNLRSWPSLTLEELTEKTRPICYGVLKPGREDPNGVPLVRVTDIASNEFNSDNLLRINANLDEEFARSRLEGGEVLISVQGTVGRVAIVPQAFAGSNISRTIAVVSPDSRVERRFLYWYFRWLGSRNAFQTVGSTRDSLNIATLRRVRVPIPSPEEQRRIADILDKADSIRRKRKEAIALTEDLLRSAFLDMFGDPVTNPKGWEEKPLSDVVREGTIVTYGIVQAGPHVDSGVPYIRTGDIKNDRIQADGLLRTSPEIAARFSRSEVRAGDLVMSIRATVGTVALVPPSLDGANLTQGTARIAPGRHVTREFLFEHIRAPGMQRWLQQRIKGATFKEITLGTLRTAPIMIPPYSLQQHFARISRQVQTVAEECSNAAHNAETLFAGLVARTFSGRATSNG